MSGSDPRTCRNIFFQTREDSGDRRHIVHDTAILSRTPDIAPDFGAAITCEAHRRYGSDCQIIRTKSGIHDGIF